MFGTSAWTRADMLAHLEEFAALYERRPIMDNSGGMSSAHLFLFWFVLQHLKPRAVIESGVWQGLGTWIIDQACPDAAVYCIDINWSHLKYRSERATYLSKDISLHDWSSLPKEKTLVFIDDHIDAIKRIRAAVAHGFRHVMIEDNYPPGKGDCYSLQEVFLHTGHRAFPGIRAKISRWLGRLQDSEIPPNTEDAAYVRSVADVYEVLPPIFKLTHTRWGEVWDERFPTPEPLLCSVEQAWQQVFLDEAKWYTWLCYVRLR